MDTKSIIHGKIKKEKKYYNFNVIFSKHILTHVVSLLNKMIKLKSINPQK